MGRLALALSLLLSGAAACGEGGTTGVGRPGNDDGTSGTPSGAELLVGAWRTVAVVEVPGDLQTWTTTWRFSEGGGALELEYGFADFSPDRLLLDGFEYQRLA